MLVRQLSKTQKNEHHILHTLAGRYFHNYFFQDTPKIFRHQLAFLACLYDEIETETLLRLLDPSKGFN